MSAGISVKGLRLLRVLKAQTISDFLSEHNIERKTTTVYYRVEKSEKIGAQKRLIQVQIASHPSSDTELLLEYPITMDEEVRYQYKFSSTGQTNFHPSQVADN